MLVEEGRQRVRCCAFGVGAEVVVEMLSEIANSAAKQWTETRLDDGRGALRRGCGAQGRRRCGWGIPRGCSLEGDRVVRGLAVEAAYRRHFRSN